MWGLPGDLRKFEPLSADLFAEQEQVLRLAVDFVVANIRDELANLRSGTHLAEAALYYDPSVR